jgi:hypothetical protein
MHSGKLYRKTTFPGQYLQRDEKVLNTSVAIPIYSAEFWPLKLTKNGRRYIKILLNGKYLTNTTSYTTIALTQEAPWVH